MAQSPCKCKGDCTPYYLEIQRSMGWGRSSPPCSALIPIFIYGYGLKTGSMDLNELFLTAPLPVPYALSAGSSNIQSGSITTNQLNEQILKYLRPEITQSPVLTKDREQIYTGQTITLSSNAEGKFLSYQWLKDEAVRSDQSGIYHNRCQRISP